MPLSPTLSTRYVRPDPRPHPTSATPFLTKQGAGIIRPRSSVHRAHDSES